MKINGTRLRQRRMELGLTSRSLAQEARVSSALIARLEDTGDASALVVSTLSAILDALSLSLIDVLEQPSVPDADEAAVRAIGSFLASQTKGAPLAVIANTLDLLLADAERATAVLEDGLRSVGMRLRRSSNGIRLVPAARAEVGTDTPSARAKYLSNLNNGDLALLYRIFTTETALHGIAQSANVTMSLQKLEGAGLIDMPTNEPIRLTERAAAILG